jgi:hypothetical protein
VLSTVFATDNVTHYVGFHFGPIVPSPDFLKGLEDTNVSGSDFIVVTSENFDAIILRNDSLPVVSFEGQFWNSTASVLQQYSVLDSVLRVFEGF